MTAKAGRLILAITGASGAVVGIRLLELLKKMEVESHLIISKSARRTIVAETGREVAAVEALASYLYSPADVGALIASGSFHTGGMLVAPCSIKTLSGIANSYSKNLIVRAADVCLKEGRPLLLGVRETPFHPGHIRLIRLASRAGAIIFPLVPSFYGGPQTVDDLVTNLAARMLQRVGLDNDYVRRWAG